MPAFRMTRRVAFSETDAATLMHFSRYAVWMEDCEHAFLRSIGQSVHTVDDEGERLFPRVNVALEFHAPLHFEDEAELHLDVARIGKRSLTYAFAFVRAGSDTPCATGTSTCVFSRATPTGLRSADLPADLVAALTAARA